MSPTKITDHADRAIARLPSQFQESPNLTAIVTALAEEGQEVEDALWQVLTERLLDGEGVQLDVAGRIVGQPRNGLADEDYLRYLRTKILVNRSTGRVRDLILVTRAALAGQTISVEVDQQGVASVVVRVLLYVVPDDVADQLIKFLRGATKAGVRIILETLGALEDDSFTFARAAFADGALSSTDTVIMVDRTAGFPASGSLVIDEATPDEETVTYSSLTSTTFTVSALANNHADRTLVSLVGGPGLGFGTDPDDPDVGGGLAAARDGGV